jgi:ankyrin repeat protein
MNILDKELLLELLNAVRDDDFVKIESYLNNEPQNFYSRLFMHHAANYGKIEMIKFLLKKGTDVNILNGTNCTPFMSAVYCRQFKTADFLMKQGADIENVRSSGRNFFMMLCLDGVNNMDQINYLINKGVNIHHFDNKGKNALFCAIEDYNDTLVRFLLERGLDINSENKKGISGVKFAVNENLALIIDIFIEKFELLNEKNKKLIYPIRLERLFS